MMTNGLEESVTRSVKWEHMDVPTFVSFWKYLYSGTYKDPEPDTESMQALATNSESVLKPLGEPMENDPASSPLSKVDKKKLKKKGRLAREAGEGTKSTDREHVRHEFKRLGERKFHQTGDADGTDVSDHDEVIENKAASSQAQHLIHHARVFILADKYDMARLMTISHGRLYAILMDLDVGTGSFMTSITNSVAYESNADHVVALLRFCFGEPVPDQLRELLVAFAATKVKELWERQSFKDLLDDSKELAMEMMRYMIMMIS